MSRLLDRIGEYEIWERIARIHWILVTFLFLAEKWSCFLHEKGHYTGDRTEYQSLQEKQAALLTGGKSDRETGETTENWTGEKEES